MRVPRMALVLAFWLPFTMTTYLAWSPLEQLDVPSTNDKFTHLLAFGYLTGAFMLAYRRWSTWQRTAVVMFAYGVLIEVVQAFLPYRSFDLRDLLADGVGIVVALSGLSAINKVFGRPRRDVNML